MGFSSEIKFKIGADTSALSKAFIGVQSVAAAASKQINREFGLKNAFKGILQGVGIGSVAAIADAVIAPFRHAAERAKAIADLTDTLRENTTKWLGALGGPTRELELQVKEVNDLNRSIEQQKALIAGLNADPLNLFGDGLEKVKEAETGLDELLKKQDGIATSVKIAALEENRRTEALQRRAVLESNLASIEMQHGVEGRKVAEKRRSLEEEYQVLRKQGALPSTLQANNNERQALEANFKLFTQQQAEKKDDIAAQMVLEKNLSDIELRDGSEREKLQARLNALKKEGEVIRRRTGFNSPEDAANRAAQASIEQQVKALAKKAGDELARALADAGSGLGNSQPSRRPKPRPRGRSEAERIADRGLDFKDHAEEAIRTGRSPKYIADLTHSAATDLKAAGKKADDATSKVSKGDSDVVKGLTAVHETLKNIEANLNPDNGD